MFQGLLQYFTHSKDKTDAPPTQSLMACFEAANDEIYTRSHGFLENRAYAFFRANDRLERLERHLKLLAGIDGYAYVGSGDNVVVVRYDKDQLIRFRAPAIAGQANTEDVPVAPMVCPIWKEIYFEQARLNFVPFIPSLARSVAVGKITRTVAESYIYALMSGCLSCDPQIWFYDYKNYDFKFEQVGVLPNGVPIIIDLGSVIYCTDAPEADRAKLADDICLANDWNLSHSGEFKWLDETGVAFINRLCRPSKLVLDLPDRLI